MIDKAIAFVGDIHGWTDRLRGILNDWQGQLVFCGDLIDRGPDSKGTVELVKQLCENGRAQCLMGNHEYALVRGLGCPEAGISAEPALYEAWCHVYGGDDTLVSYGCDPFDPPAMRQAMGDHLPWMARLPWYLEGTVAGKPWLAVHAGLSNEPVGQQLEHLSGPDRWLLGAHEHPRQLYSKRLLDSRPSDISKGVCIVSGHTPISQPLATSTRILCDTSGGRTHRPLTAVVFPEMRVLQAQ